jgi:hypothetical protein
MKTIVIGLYLCGLVLAAEPAVDPANPQTPKEDTIEDSNYTLVLGIGSQIINANHSDYKVSNDILQAKTQGKATPLLLTGVAFRLPVPKWNAFVSLRFAPDSNHTFNGYVFGATYRVSKYLDLLAGLSFAPYDQASPGFRKLAAQAVRDQPNLYRTFDAAAIEADKANALDGFPLLQSGSSTRIYGGDPTTTHYRSGFVAGISIPVSFGAKLGGSTDKGPN